VIRTALALLSLPLALSACDRQFVQACPPLVLPESAVAFSAPPFQQVRRAHLRLRFETLDLVDVPVSIDLPDERCTSVRTPDIDRADRAWAFPEDAEVAHPDVAGEHVLHTTEILFEDLPEAERVPVTVHAGREPADALTADLRAPQAFGEPATVLFAASLAPPTQADVLGLVDSADLVLLGGDLRRNGTPESTWSQLAHDLHATQPGALVHTALGDLEDLTPDSREVWLRWFAGQGRPGGDDRYYALDLAGVRFLVLDGEDMRLDTEGGAQWSWIASELEDVAESDTLREAVVIMHRGPHSLTVQLPNFDLRDTLLPMLAEGGVRLLISGQGHGYQRFDDAGLVIIDEGGGGAELTDIDHRLEQDPEGVDARVVASSTHGALRLQIGADGALSLTRLAVDGSTVDEVSLPAP